VITEVGFYTFYRSHAFLLPLSKCLREHEPLIMQTTEINKENQPVDIICSWSTSWCLREGMPHPLCRCKYPLLQKTAN